MDRCPVWTGATKKISVSNQNRKFEKFTLAPNTESSNMSLLKKFSKSTQDLREKKKWKMSTFKPKRKEQDYIFWKIIWVFFLFSRFLDTIGWRQLVLRDIHIDINLYEYSVFGTKNHYIFYSKHTSNFLMTIMIVTSTS